MINVNDLFMYENRFLEASYNYPESSNMADYRGFYVSYGLGPESRYTARAYKRARQEKKLKKERRSGRKRATSA
jgi:hypothetical protein